MMTRERGARDRRFELSVEEPTAIGAARLFDGNHTDDLLSWMFANSYWDDSLVPDTLDKLMGYTIDGHLSWVIFPPQGYVVPDVVLDRLGVDTSS
jgi:hypothetical protein